MMPVADSLTNLTTQGDKSHIKLPNGTPVVIDKIGNMQLPCSPILTRLRHYF